MSYFDRSAREKKYKDLIDEYLIHYECVSCKTQSPEKMYCPEDYICDICKNKSVEIKI